MDTQIKRLINELSTIGRATYFSYDFSDAEHPDYATIELETDLEKAGCLEVFVTSHLNPNNGYEAALRFIQVHDSGNGVCRYLIEIVPLDHLHDEKSRIRETERFLASLPKVIHDFKMHNPARGKKKSKFN
jgi:hypothetical protein